MQRVKLYTKIISSTSDFQAFEDGLNKLLLDGWQLQGDTSINEIGCINRPFMMQSLIRGIPFVLEEKAKTLSLQEIDTTGQVIWSDK